MIDSMLHQVFFQNTVLDYLIAAGVFIAGIIVILVLKRFILKRFQKWAERTENTVDDFVAMIIEKRLLPLVYFGLFYLCIQGLKLAPILIKGINIVGLLLLVFIGVRFFLSVSDYSIDNYFIRKRTVDLSKQQAIKVISNAFKILTWSLAVIIILDNLGIKISALMTGLGNAGGAVAFASQAVLGDMFNYFTIFFDNPFSLGDFIVIGELMGTVEHIGIKTTRIRSLGGEQLIISNTDLANSRVKNYKTMERRRVLFKIGVTYDTPLELLREIPDIVRGDNYEL